MFHTAFLFWVLQAKRKISTRLFFHNFFHDVTISLAPSSCKDAEMVCTGLGMAPKTNSAGHRPSRLKVEFITNTVSCKHSLLVVLWSVSACLRSYAKYSEAWYPLTTSKALSASNGVSSRRKTKASTDMFTSFDIYADPLSKIRILKKRGRVPKYTRDHICSMAFEIFVGDWLRKKEAAQKRVAFSTMWRMGWPLINMVSTCIRWIYLGHLKPTVSFHLRDRMQTRRIFCSHH